MGGSGSKNQKPKLSTAVPVVSDIEAAREHCEHSPKVAGVNVHDWEPSHVKLKPVGFDYKQSPGATRPEWQYMYTFRVTGQEERCDEMAGIDDDRPMLIRTHSLHRTYNLSPPSKLTAEEGNGTGSYTVAYDCDLPLEQILIEPDSAMRTALQTLENTDPGITGRIHVDQWGLALRQKTNATYPVYVFLTRDPQDDGTYHEVCVSATDGVTKEHKKSGAE